MALAVDPVLGISLLFGACYALILIFAPIWALIAFVPLLFLGGTSALNLGAKLAGLLVAAAWIGAALSRRKEIEQAIRQHRRLFEGLAALLLWFSLTALWAAEPGLVLGDIWHWASVALLFTIVATWVAEEKTLIWLCGAFIAGAALSVVIGAGTGGIGAEAVTAESRLEGAIGDPNFLAAGLVPAIVLAAGVMAVVRNPLARLGCAAAILICGIGVAATQSKGGVLALLVSAVAALIVFRNRRIYVALTCFVIASLGAAYFSVTPNAWERVTDLDGGSGRTDLWSIAWQATEDNPVSGIGLRNYAVVAKDYTRLPGSLTNVNKISEDPHVVHNTYLEALTETGIVGLALFLVVSVGSCYAAWLAARRFDSLHRIGMAALARAIVVATTAMMAAAFFLSAGVDRRLWVLFALGPATLGIAERSRRYGTTAPYPSPPVAGSAMTVPEKEIPSP